MNDRELIYAVAWFWLDHGGDAEGFSYSWDRIRECIAELQEQDSRERTDRDYLRLRLQKDK